MAVFALTSCFVSINSVDMSQYVAGVELSIEANELDTTDFASSGWKEVIGGLKSGNVRVRFNQDFASTTVDDRLFALFGTVTAFLVRPTSASVGATNPNYTFSALINNYQPVTGNVGDLATMDLTWPISGAVTRATS